MFLNLSETYGKQPQKCSSFIDLHNQSGSGNEEEATVAAGAEVTDRARFLLLRQKYTEAVQCGETAAALQVLRLELQPLELLLMLGQLLALPLEAVQIQQLLGQVEALHQALLLAG